MTEADTQKMVANYMGAVAHLFCGKLGRDEEFHATVDILLAGSPPQLMQLWQLAGRHRSPPRFTTARDQARRSEQDRRVRPTPRHEPVWSVPAAKQRRRKYGSPDPARAGIDTLNQELNE
ncbi:hypothetical protein [Sphingomonas sp. BAUL-RG-20F-R05-02]|uniref:hypothetical protein n=1 Tax=Sphingomonas sp. BAUL-RG-20F-R05-02 TaxID=2914830 RepID=UPI001F563995|nr:hypothetical protein [Sphingomonas sp. BAUL-RG-20F-R05-02]